MSEKTAPIIGIKKKVAHAGHHGGAWKVAYADFVTAMMALFIVLWLTSSTSKKDQELIAGYFQDPKSNSALKGTNLAGNEQNMDLRMEDMNKLKVAIMRSVYRINNLKGLEKQIEMTITPEGLRIELLESKNGTFFESGSTKPKPALVEILTAVSGQLSTLPNRVSIEGHTDSQRYQNEQSYSNWELSVDRANVARKLMQEKGLRADQVAQVRGFADQRLRNPQNPYDAANRRISLVVDYPKGPAAKLAAIAASQAPAAKPAAGTPTAAKEAPKPAK